MPIYIDPCWEYWEPQDPEVAEIFTQHRPSLCDLFDDRLYKTAKLGMRFGRGSPDKFLFRLARGGEVTSGGPYLGTCVVCGRLFPVGRAGVRHCGLSCVPRPGRSRRLIDIACATCGKVFRPRTVDSRYCTVKCASQAGAAARRIVNNSTPQEAGGCPVCGRPVSGMGRNGVPRKYCGVRCKCIMSRRAYSQRAKYHTSCLSQRP